MRVELVPLERLAEAIAPAHDVVAFSAVQSADGRLADLAAVADAAAQHGVRTFVDATQAAGWLPLDLAPLRLHAPPPTSGCCSRAGPRSSRSGRSGATSSSRTRPAGTRARTSPLPTTARRCGWRADARRFDTSPAWLNWVGAAGRSRCWRTSASRRSTRTTSRSRRGCATGSGWSRATRRSSRSAGCRTTRPTGSPRPASWRRPRRRAAALLSPLHDGRRRRPRARRAEPVEPWGKAGDSVSPLVGEPPPRGSPAAERRAHARVAEHRDQPLAMLRPDRLAAHTTCVENHIFGQDGRSDADIASSDARPRSILLAVAPARGGARRRLRDRPGGVPGVDRLDRLLQPDDDRVRRRRARVRGREERADQSATTRSPTRARPRSRTSRTPCTTSGTAACSGWRSTRTSRTAGRTSTCSTRTTRTRPTRRSRAGPTTARRRRARRATAAWSPAGSPA